MINTYDGNIYHDILRPTWHFPSTGRQFANHCFTAFMWTALGFLPRSCLAAAISHPETDLFCGKCCCCCIFYISRCEGEALFPLLLRNAAGDPVLWYSIFALPFEVRIFSIEVFNSLEWHKQAWVASISIKQ